MFGGYLLNFKSKLPTTLKMLFLNGVRVKSEIIENGISGTNLEQLHLYNVSSETEDSQSIKSLRVDLSQLNLRHVKSMEFTDLDLVENLPSITEFNQLEKLVFNGNILIQGPVNSFNAAPIKRLSVYDGIQFQNTSFKDAFGRNEHIELITLGFQNQPLSTSFNLAEFPTKLLKKISIFASTIEIANTGNLHIKFGKTYLS